MDFDFKPVPSESNPDSMDFLSLAWCNFAVQAFQPPINDRSIVLHDNSYRKLEKTDVATLLKVSESPFIYSISLLI